MEKTIAEKRIEIFQKTGPFKYKNNFDAFFSIYQKYANALSPEEFDNAVKMVYDKHQENYFKIITTNGCIDDFNKACYSELEEVLRKISEEKMSKLIRLIKKEQLQRR